MLESCGSGDVFSVKRLIRHGCSYEHADYDGRTPFHVAASEGQMGVIQYLFNRGLKNKNPIDRWNNTPLDDAMRGGHTELSRFLD